MKIKNTKPNTKKHLTQNTAKPKPVKLKTMITPMAKSKFGLPAFLHRDWWNFKRFLLAMAAVSVVAFGAGQIAHRMNQLPLSPLSQKTSRTSEASAASSSKPTKTSKQTAAVKDKTASASDPITAGVQAKLTKQAQATHQSYKVQTVPLGGGYIMGTVTYFPDDPTKTYLDNSITAPKKPAAESHDAQAKSINRKLTKTLPKINQTIVVKEAKEVTLATYKQEDGSYHTILLYHQRPFGFVTTKANGSMVNSVTTYYMQNVKK